MNKNKIFTCTMLLFASFAASAADKMVSTKTHVRFFSTTPIENIEANNYASMSTYNIKTGEGVAVVPIQSFEFEKTLMQEHFNGAQYMNSKEFPNAKIKGKLTNLKAINFKKDGTYPVTITGEMTIKGKTKPVTQSGIVEVKGKVVTVTGKFFITLADYGILVGSSSPTSKIADKVEVSVLAIYQLE